jgi:hypothetical protein
MTPRRTKKARKAATRESLGVGELSDEELAAIAAAEVPSEYDRIDQELTSPPDIKKRFNQGDGL